jgi:Protein of unknown function (DUF2877)
MKAKVVTPRALRWLQSGRPARILNIFEQVCNLANDRGELLSLVTQRIGAGPFSLVLDQTDFAALDVDSPITVSSNGRSLRIGSLRIETEQAEIWNPRPDWNALAGRRIPALYDPPVLPAHLYLPLQHILEGIACEDIIACETGVYDLAGAGIGLTPAGDDILLGLLYGLWVWHPRRRFIQLIVRTAAPRTTTLSAAFLKAAEEGEAAVGWHNLVRGRPGAIEQILSTGSTSGRDAWNGFISVAQFRQEKPHFEETKSDFRV